MDNSIIDDFVVKSKAYRKKITVKKISTLTKISAMLIDSIRNILIYYFFNLSLDFMINNSAILNLKFDELIFV